MTTYNNEAYGMQSAPATTETTTYAFDPVSSAVIQGLPQIHQSHQKLQPVVDCNIGLVTQACQGNRIAVKSGLSYDQFLEGLLFQDEQMLRPGQFLYYTHAVFENVMEANITPVHKPNMSQGRLFLTNHRIMLLAAEESQAISERATALKIMMDARKSYLVAQFVAILLPCLAFSGDQVPLIAWSSTDSFLSTPHIDAGHVVTQQSLQHDYLDILPMDQPHNLFLIVMDKLSIDDITRYSNAHSSSKDGGSLSHLKSAMESSTSHLVLPAAETIDLESDLRSRVSGQVFELSTPSLKNIKFDNTKSNLIIIRLNSATSESRQAAMTSLDQALLQILGQLPGRFSPYTVVLTAQKPSRVVKEKPQAGSVNIGRRLLAEDSNEYIFVNYTSGDCQAFFYSTNMTLEVNNVTGANHMENIDLPNDGWLTTGSECYNKSLKLVLFHDKLDDQDISSFTLSMMFNQSGGSYNFWYLSSVIVSIIDQSSDYSFEMDPHDFEPNNLYSPVGLSYHCSNIFVHEKGNKTHIDDKVTLLIQEFQVQPFGIKYDQFSLANDCIGYFSPGIWMGLVLTIILLLILGVGMGMLADLKVMDKFDDPKGKGITVNTAE